MPPLLPGLPALSVVSWPGLLAAWRVCRLRAGSAALFCFFFGAVEAFASSSAVEVASSFASFLAAAHSPALLPALSLIALPPLWLSSLARLSSMALSSFATCDFNDANRLFLRSFASCLTGEAAAFSLAVEAAATLREASQIGSGRHLPRCALMRQAATKKCACVDAPADKRVREYVRGYVCRKRKTSFEMTCKHNNM